MKSIRVSAQRTIAAPAHVLYNIIADYDEGHPRILPPQYFADFQVEAGGRGAGTVISYKLRLMGRWNPARARVSEPVPGRVLQETLVDADLVTTFTVEPLGDGSGTHVVFETVWQSPWWRAPIERLLAPRMLLPVYREELQNLDREARHAMATQPSIEA